MYNDDDNDFKIFISLIIKLTYLIKKTIFNTCKYRQNEEYK